MLIFKNADVHAPERLGKQDVLIAGGQIVALGEDLALPRGVAGEVIDVEGLRMLPGLIDCHVHIAGAGGEGGPATRTRELELGQMLEGGITTVIGCLGTDGLTRSLESVLMKVKSLRAEGVSAWMYTGSYQVPPPTLLGDVGRDIALIDEVIGVGEIAIADHRSSSPSPEDVRRLALHARVGGMLGGKAGIVNIHLGNGPDPFRTITDAVATGELTLAQFLPTHVTRNPHAFEAAKIYGREGFVDITASSFPYFPDEEVDPAHAIVELVAAGVPLHHITVSSDGCGSLPRFDAAGNFEGLDVGLPRSILDVLRIVVEREEVPLEDAVRVVTSNVADILKLPHKGRIKPGCDADLVLLDDSFEPHHVMARGRLLVRGSST